MLMMDAMKPGPLDEYEETVRGLDAVYGSKYWGLIARADDVMRSEEWERIRREVESKIARRVYQGDYDPQRPWAAVVREAARDSRYWTENVKELAVIDATPGLSVIRAAANTQAVVGTTGSDSSGHRRRSPSRRRSRSRRRSPAGRTKRSAKKDNAKRSDKRHFTNSEGVQLCYAWNRQKDGCTSSGACSTDRAHQCEWCLGPHRAIDPACRTKPKGWTPPAPKRNGKYKK